jgi:hypothetical protein
MDLKQNLINFNFDEVEAFVYKTYMEKTNINAESDIIYEIFKKIVPTFTEEIIASIYVSGFREKYNKIAEKKF